MLHFIMMQGTKLEKLVSPQASVVQKLMIDTLVEIFKQTSMSERRAWGIIFILVAIQLPEKAKGISIKEMSIRARYDSRAYLLSEIAFYLDSVPLWIHLEPPDTVRMETYNEAAQRLLREMKEKYPEQLEAIRERFRANGFQLTSE